MKWASWKPQHINIGVCIFIVTFFRIHEAGETAKAAFRPDLKKLDWTSHIYAGNWKT